MQMSNSTESSSLMGQNALKLLMPHKHTLVPGHYMEHPHTEFLVSHCSSSWNTNPSIGYLCFPGGSKDHWFCFYWSHCLVGPRASQMDYTGLSQLGLWAICVFHGPSSAISPCDHRKEFARKRWRHQRGLQYVSDSEHKLWSQAISSPHSQWFPDCWCLFLCAGVSGLKGGVTGEWKGRVSVRVICHLAKWQFVLCSYMS